MLWRRKQNSEVLPWYRDPTYKGPLTESEKRKLDAFRSEAKHPSTRCEDLPDEVQGYIAGLETQVYDLRQEKAASKAILCTLAAVALIYFHYKPLSLSAFLSWAIGLLLIVIPWLVYRFEWNKNARNFMPSSPACLTDEAIRREWEVNYVARCRNRDKVTV